VVTVFGGTGFLGRRIVRQLCDGEFIVRVASRHPQQRQSEQSGPRAEPIKADIRDEQSVARAVAGAYAVVNAVSLYVERGADTFHSMHVEAARRMAAQAQRTGVERLVHLSGIGADPASRSRYIQKRGEGELAVRAAFTPATIVRSAGMFGPDDAFLATIVDLLRSAPVFPLFGRGHTRLQPAFVDDVAEAIVRIVRRPDTRGTTFECGGPHVYSYDELIRIVAREADLTPTLCPVPFAVWHVLAGIAEILPGPPLTRNQVELMQIDNVASVGMPGFGQLEILPRSFDDIVRKILRPV